ncbi:hypothetical protein OG500_24270 [Kitasatospora sp. NBC_01250]|uniref:hypothetical protein n=1 Tax=unclassified Kitasatospora TaxID=2633591 RepID=UPI002E126838|nr:MULTISPECIES: hypothetical protein [unclassified Kitasatospora]WSJ69245.1 hypothetical protein OG294_25820 [Kitasatospora sp. NBC_01302]
MHINWSALADTAGVSFLVTVAVVSAFALGILALSRREAAVEAAKASAPGGGSGTVALAAAGVCFAACAAAVGYGLTLIAS